MNIKLIITTIALAASTGLQAQSVSAPLKVNGSGDEANNYFTAVIFSDPHVEQADHDGADVATFKAYCDAIIALGKTGKQYQFNALPGYTPKADIVFCLGDMDKDNEKAGTDFKAAFHKLNAAGIPFITMLGNHDVVPDYWTGDNPDEGLTLGGAVSNTVAMNLVKAQVDTATTCGITNVEWITDGTSHTQLSPFTFTFQGVRFYCGQAYWFQKPYERKLLSKTYYAPDGVIKALETLVAKHTDEPSVWMQHYPFTYGSDNNRWWLDQTDVGKYIATADESEYGTHISTLGKYDTDATAQAYAKKKKDKLADIIKQTKNAVHFSGHVHSYGDYTYDDVRDYTVAAPGITSGGMFLVLMSKTDGVVEVKKIDLADVAYSQADSTGVIDNTDDVTLTAGTDVSSLLGDNLNFETTEEAAYANTTNLHSQPGWNHVWSVDATSNNVQYTHAYQVNATSGATTSKALRLRTKWQKNAVNNYIFKEAVLPAGNYTLSYYINKYATAGISEDLCYYELGGKRTMLPATTGSWSKQTVKLTLTKADTLHLNFGYRGGAGDKEALVYVDDVQLLKIPSVTIDENTTFEPTAQEADVMLQRTFKAGAWNSLVVPFAISDEAAKQVFGSDVQVCNYIGSTRNDDGTYTLNFSSSTDGILANTPVFIYGVSTAAPYRFDNALIEVPDNSLTATDTQSGVFSFIGSYTVPCSLSAGDWFISSDNNFYRANGKETMSGTRAVFRPTANNATLAKMSVDDTSTDIRTTIAGNPTGDTIYNLQGQKLTAAPAHGVFIRNGHKVVK